MTFKHFIKLEVVEVIRLSELVSFDPRQVTRSGSDRLRGEKLNYKSVAKEISKPPFFGS